MLPTLLAERDHVLLGFDGPVCTMFGGPPSARDIADRLKVLLGRGLPPDVADSGDPFDILRYAVSCGPATAKVVETQLTRLELEAVAAAVETEGLAPALAVLHDRGFTITVVSNHSTEAVKAFLVVHELTRYVRRASARVQPDPERFMPNPFLIENAMRALGASPGSCFAVLGSATDIEAAHAAQVPIVGYATDPGLLRDGDTTIEHLTELRPWRGPTGA